MPLSLVLPGYNSAMLGFAISIAVGCLWILLWTVVLHAAGIPVFRRGPEQREIRRQRFLRMGQARYVLVDGILGSGVAVGLAIAVADLEKRPSDGWIGAVFKTVFVAVIFGWWHGSDGWAKLRGPVPFPPESLREK